MSWNNVMPASAFNPADPAPAPKSNRGRKPSPWQLSGKTSVYDPTHDTTYDYATEKEAKAVLAYARAFGYIPEEARRGTRW